MTTTLKVSYRPFSGTLSVWDIADDTMPESMLGERVDNHQDGDDENYFVSVMTLDGHFHALTVLDIRNAGQHWNLWASAYLPDEVIVTIADLVDGWNGQYEENYEMIIPMLTCYKTTVEV
jgi:hypothetical protein